MIIATCWVLLLTIAPLYLLYGLYAAVMNFKRAKDAGKLSKAGLALGYPYFAIGMLLDVYCNTIPLSIILWEYPQWFVMDGWKMTIGRMELTVSQRVTRHSQFGGWRGDVARWFCEDLLNSLDPSGLHCKP